MPIFKIDAANSKEKLMQVLAPWCVAVWHCCLCLRFRVFPAPEHTFSREKLRWDFLLKIENVYGLDESEFMHEGPIKASNAFVN